MKKEVNEVINPSKYFRKKRNELLKNALQTTARPITLEALFTLQTNGQLSIEAFKDNIGKIFPLILSMVSEGHSILYIEKFLGMNHRSLQAFIDKHARLKKACNEARKVKLDRKALEAVELQELLS